MERLGAGGPWAAFLLRGVLHLSPLAGQIQQRRPPCVGRRCCIWCLADRFLPIEPAAGSECCSALQLLQLARLAIPLLGVGQRVLLLADIGPYLGKLGIELDERLLTLG